mmetsp:Transcript_19163/g.47373  ORF Transcript_19163/g.47373 Transcript_19163/m.47373 type:complete len:240 (-) Transcript_19163:965-1684(-)
MIMNQLVVVVLAEADRDLLHVGAVEVGVEVEAVVDQDRQDHDEDDHLLGDTEGDQGAVVLVQQLAPAVDRLLMVEDMVVTEIVLEVVEEEDLALVEEKSMDATMDHPVGPMVNPLTIPLVAQVLMVLQEEEEEEDLHPAVEESVDAVRKGLLESPSWCETYLPMQPLLICKGPLARLEKFGMFTFQETTTRNSQRDLPLLNMPTLKWQGKQEMRWTGFESRDENSKLCLLKSDARLLVR